nr:insulinase family protein [Jeotgalicoccus pinnipedialis]
MSFGKIEHIDSITLDDIMREHKKMMKEDEMVILVVGQTSDEEVESLKKIYSRDNYVKLPYHGFDGQITNVINYQTDYEKIEQAKTILGFRIEKKQADMMSARIFNRMFGGSAASYLFMNLREKLSLAYQIHSELDIKNGVLFAIAGVDFNRVKETEIHVMKELDKFRNGEFTEEFLEESKNQFLSARLDSMDKPKGVIATLYGHFLAGVDFEYVDEQLSRVTRESVINVAKHTHLDTVYTLTGGETNESETL